MKCRWKGGNVDKKYSIEKILDAIIQAKYDVMAAFECEDREILRDGLMEYLE